MRGAPPTPAHRIPRVALRSEGGFATHPSNVARPLTSVTSFYKKSYGFDKRAFAALSQKRLSQGKASGQSHECFFQKPLAKEKTLWRHNIIFTNTLQKLAECFFFARTKTPPQKNRPLRK
jgi:hypothetical protein